MQVKIKKLHPKAVIPQRHSDLAAGWDVVATEIELERIISLDDNIAICKLGFSLQPPANYRVVLIPRSSITNSYWVMQNSPGCGDPDYTGEYMMKFKCLPIDVELNHDSSSAMLNYEDFPYKVGDRIGQLFLQEIIHIEFEEVDELNSTERGEGGFGSTNDN